jgi:conjugative transfer ATPase
MMQLMAVYRPRLVIIDAGNSFGLLSEYFKTQGLSVNRVEIAFNNSISLNPFADSKKMLQQIEHKQKQVKIFDAHNSNVFNDGSLQKALADIEEALTDELTDLNNNDLSSHQNINNPNDVMPQGEEENRDYMGEMALAAQLMITGGEPKEADNLTREDRYWILTALVEAAKAADAQGRNQMIAGDLIAAFLRLAGNLEKENKLSDHDIIKRLKKMAANIQLFCQDNLSARYFNTEGQPWPEADVTILEMGIFKDEGYDAQRALAFLGAMNKTLSFAEQHQYDERFTVFFADECHIVTNNPLTAASVTKCSKMSRKVGLWLWFASQNVKDFPNESRKMLSMMEFWLCLGMSEAEMAEIERFKPLSEEEKHLFRSVRKEAKKYVEGVLLCSRFKGLFRNIPPRLALALAMTEKHEKAERKKLMGQFNCTEIEAAMKVAETMMQH